MVQRIHLVRPSPHSLVDWEVLELCANTWNGDNVWVILENSQATARKRPSSLE